LGLFADSAISSSLAPLGGRGLGVTGARQGAEIRRVLVEIHVPPRGHPPSRAAAWVGGTA
jgi:hypothetical protein